MSWASRRRFIITASGASLIVFVLALILVPTFYQSPSCTDTIQNQGEEGVDCGGSCTYLCTDKVQAPIVRFTKAVFPTTNRVDVIAYIDNPNPSASARAVPYTITLYDAEQLTLKTEKGEFDLPAARSVPVFVPNLYMGNVEGVRAFLTVDSALIRWSTAYRTMPVSTITEGPSITGTVDAPRVTATFSNPGATPLAGGKVVAIVYDAQGTVVASSQTLLPSIAAQGSAEAVFTWGRAFPGTPARIEVVPVLVLGAKSP